MSDLVLFPTYTHGWSNLDWFAQKMFCFWWNFCENIDFNNVDIHSTTSPFILAVQVLSGLFWKTFIFPPNKWLNTTLFWWHFILIYSTNVYTIFLSSKVFTMVNQPAGALVFCTHIGVLNGEHFTFLSKMGSVILFSS